MEKPYERMMNELTMAERQAVKAEIAKPNPAIKVLATWQDDHLPCVGVKIGDVEVGFWWIGTMEVGAFYFPDSAKALEVIRITLQDQGG